MNKQKKSYTMSINFEDFKELPFYMEYLESIHNQNFNEDFEKFYSMLCELEFEHVNVQILNLYLQKLLNFIFLKIREKKTWNIRSSISLYLNILYLTMCTKNENFSEIISSDKYISAKYIHLLSK